MTTLAIVLAVFLLSSECSASIEDHCTDISYWDEIRYETTTKQCCDTKLKQVCTTKSDQVCQDVLELQCEVIAWGECQSTPTSTQSITCGVKFNDFAHHNCKEVATSVPHSKKVPECKEITKNNCVTDWDVDSNGNKVWAGTETCTPVTWEECEIVEKTVEFPTVKTECNVNSHIKWAELVDITSNLAGLESKCEVKKAVDCKHVVANKCARVVWQECKMEPREECRAVVIHTPIQDKIHQKKCLTGATPTHLNQIQPLNRAFHSDSASLVDAFIFEDDMMLDKTQIEWLKDNLLFGKLDGFSPKERNNTDGDISHSALTDPKFLWPDNLVYYSFDDKLTLKEKTNVREVLAGLQEKLSSCITFKERNQGNRVVVVTDGGSQGPRGCWSYVGYKNMAQELNLQKSSPCWMTGTIEHEFLHAIGIFHTHSRKDRNDHVQIIKDNIREKSIENFNIYEKRAVSFFDLPYDYNSVMHYPKWAFGKREGDITIRTLDPSKQDIIGQSEGVSTGDIDLVRIAYGCDSGCLTSPGYPDHYPAKSDVTQILSVEAGWAIEIRFHDFDVEKDEKRDECSYDYLEFFDGNENTVGKKLCGESLPQNLIISTSTATAVFHSDNNEQRKGYKFCYKPAVDGGWSDWGEYGECSEECGGGKQTRMRTCTNPAPQHGGLTCDEQKIGDPTETMDCNIHACGTYKKMEYSSFCSGSWASITSEATCRAAAAALDLKWAHSWDGPADFPGCLHTKDSRNSVYFNTSPKPSNNPNVNANYAEICQAQADKLYIGEKLSVGELLRSDNEKYDFVVQHDGNMVVYQNDNKKVLWNSDTKTPGSDLVFQGDGNLILIKDDIVVWSSGTQYKAGEPEETIAQALVMQGEGNLVLYSKAGKVLWASNNQGPKPRQQNIADRGYQPDCGADWYDVQGQGVKNDYCRWVGDCGCRGDCSWWSCALAGSNEPYSPKGEYTEPGNH